MSKRVLFVDPCCPKPYTFSSIATEPMGGTEATVARVASGLKANGHDVRVMQHNRTTVDGIFEPFSTLTDWEPHSVVVLRVPSVLREARVRFPLAKTFLWAHDLFGGDGPQLNAWFQIIKDTDSSVVVVSDFHRLNMTEAMRSVGQSGIRSVRIYNPVVPGIPVSDTVDLNKVCFFSSPHKGFDLTLKCFAQFQNFPDLKDVKLHVCNPGYYPNASTDNGMVVNHGALPHPKVMEVVADSLCVLHLNNVFPETFGIVHGEANALRVPVLTSRMGANLEVLDHPQELIDVTDFKAVIERVRAWKSHGRPKVRANAAFFISKIFKEWEAIL